MDPFTPASVSVLTGSSTRCDEEVNGPTFGLLTTLDDDVDDDLAVGGLVEEICRSVTPCKSATENPPPLVDCGLEVVGSLPDAPVESDPATADELVSADGFDFFSCMDYILKEENKKLSVKLF
jgi:hypothetical protein